MNREDIINMDPNLLISIVNMKLRDNYDSLESLCYDLDLREEDIIHRCKSIGYEYSKLHNQFKAF
ncbi:DUF4250 domain-containing protein [Clostridium taeniosporum]|uniref:DUF4250 domain-containing protein n=1 Tax=Clostridium taeniosporum TaxID=394958 RepID=A0A1D7XI43_9CLOT|nr:DUF4250 domain-containing protein [Clostridium taeniosporum]AOR22850.1 DUF4250 domain-containing protein [Clostridium taeniosporum]